MPELPEVESLRLGLINRILNQKILKIKVLREKIVSGKGTKRVASKDKVREFETNLINQKIINIDRIAKNLIFKIENNSKIIAHLKMTGQFVYTTLTLGKELGISGGHPIEISETSLPNKHTCIVFELEKGNLYYNDVRQFGYVLYYANDDEIVKDKHFQNQTMEPFSPNFTLSYFQIEIKKKNKSIKKVFLDQEIVNGCGNIYADEICFASAVSPMRICKDLNKIEIENLYTNIKTILQNAIDSGGSSVVNYLLADGSRGNYAHFHKAYKQEGKACEFVNLKNKKCSGVIEKINFAGRGTHFCPVHQK